MAETNEEKLVRLAPALTESEKKQINGRFKSYIFRRSKTGEVWTTCCGVYKKLEDGVTEREWAVLTALHTPAEDIRWGRDKNAPASKMRVECPWCGAEASVKEIRYTGARKNLWEFRRAVVLRQWRGNLWACSYDCTKDYSIKGELTNLPEMKLLGVYRFRIGSAESATRTWYAQTPRTYTCQTELDKKDMWRIPRPFGWCNEYGLGYEVIGLEEVDKSVFRYCGVEKLMRLGCDLIRLLTACCLYPAQIEFLQKAGMESAVRELVENKLKNAMAIHWDAKNRRDFLGITPKDLQWLREMDVQPWVRVDGVAIWRRMHGTRGESDLRDCVRLAEKQMDIKKRNSVLKRMKENGVSVGKLLAYIEREGSKRSTMTNALNAYADYLMAAEGVGLDLTNPIFLLPKDFEKKHDQVTAAWSKVQEERRREADVRRREADAKRFRKRLQGLSVRYTYTDGELLIRPAASAEEIVREGKLLHHCVGGYADRHISGATTILFLRRRSAPGKPLCTIEVRGNSIVQIHGWDDERTACEDNPERRSPRELYREFLEEWTAWMEAGSPRDKAGRPKIKKKKVRKTA